MMASHFAAVAACLGFAAALAAAEPAKPVNGLSAHAEVVNNEIKLTLKNASERPLLLCTWIGQRCIEVAWTGPDCKPRESNHYEWMTRARIRAVIADDFVTLKPGESLVFGPQGKDSALALPGAEAGKHRIKITFKNAHDGKAFKLDGVWTGSIAANEVALTIK